MFRRHEESVHCLAFAPDSSILLTACTLGNIRISYMDNETDGMSNIFIFRSFMFSSKILPKRLSKYN